MRSLTYQQAILLRLLKQYGPVWIRPPLFDFPSEFSPEDMRRRISNALHYYPAPAYLLHSRRYVEAIPNSPFEPDRWRISAAGLEALAAYDREVMAALRQRYLPADTAPRRTRQLRLPCAEYLRTPVVCLP